MRTNPFVFAIMASIVLAYFFPHLAAADRGIPIGKITSIGISLIFFFYGLKLSTEAFKIGLKN